MDQSNHRPYFEGSLFHEWRLKICDEHKYFQTADLFDGQRVNLVAIIDFQETKLLKLPYSISRAMPSP